MYPTEITTESAKLAISRELERRQEISSLEAKRTRMLFKVACASITLAIAWQIFSLRTATTLNLLGAINLFGLLVLTLVGAFDAPPSRVRMVQTAIALAIVVPASIWLQLR